MRRGRRLPERDSNPRPSAYARRLQIKAQKRQGARVGRSRLRSGDEAQPEARARGRRASARGVRPEVRERRVAQLHGAGCQPPLKIAQATPAEAAGVGVQSSFHSLQSSSSFDSDRTSSPPGMQGSLMKSMPAMTQLPVGLPSGSPAGPQNGMHGQDPVDEGEQLELHGDAHGASARVPGVAWPRPELSEKLLTQ